VLGVKQRRRVGMTERVIRKVRTRLRCELVHQLATIINNAFVQHTSCTVALISSPLCATCRCHTLSQQRNSTTFSTLCAAI
jgi:hypothetical protein